MSVLVPALLLSAAVVYFVLFPVAAGVQAPMDPEGEEATESQHRKRVALLALRDVEYDFQAGKLDRADYLQMKRELSDEALVAIDREESELRERASGGGPTEGASKGAPAALEAEIAALRTSIREGVVCGQCGHPNPRGSRYCGDCGSALPGDL